MEQKFLTLFSEALDKDISGVCMDDNFREYPEWNSLAYLSVIAMFDEEYDILIEYSEFKTLITVRDLYNKTKK